MYWNSKKKNWELKTPFSFLFFVISARGKISVVNDFSLFIFVSSMNFIEKFNKRKCNSSLLQV